MGSSLVMYQGSGFGTRDFSLQAWLGLLASEIDRKVEPSPWLQSLAVRWREESFSETYGAIQPALDEVVTELPRSVIVRICDQALHRLVTEIVQEDGYVSAIAIWSGVRDPKVQKLPNSFPAKHVRFVGTAFLALLRGDLKTPGYRFPVLGLDGTLSFRDE